MRSTAIIALALLAPGILLGQDSYTIAEPEINTCQASLQDTGGEPGGGYQNNEDLTTVVCPDSPGQGISLNFGATPFNLSTAGTAPLDQLSIWDGPDDTYPLIGTWAGSDSPGIITASFQNVQNTGGCLTVRFTSNETGTGRFAAFISCSVPCEPPSAIASILGAPQLPLLACQNEVITFDASASTAAEGFTIAEYKWDFDDGVVDSLTGAVVEHAFPEPGEYVIQVYLTDDNDCASTNLIDLQVLVSTTPIFAGSTMADTTVCQGQTVVLDATGIVPVTWSAIPEANFGDGIYLPDDQSQPFNSTLTFGGFAPNATLQDIADLESICVSMEHSYMGDLVIFVTCPNGQNVYFHQQGGGGTFIGNALDGETDPPTPGECLDYCWDPNATNGTWADNTGVSPIPSGSYESVQPMTQLIGCPLNGTWTFTVNDLFGADDGFLCSWEINFDPSLYPDLTEFTPDLGLSTLDSSNWSGPNVVTDANAPLVGVINTPNAGVFDYIFSVTDNFGCTYDTTITVTVTPSPQAPLVITGDNQICADGIAYLSAPGGFDTYLWNPSGATGPNVNVQQGTYTVTVAFGDCPLTSDPFEVRLVPNPVPIIQGTPFSCGGEPVTLSTTEEYASYQWSNSSQAATVQVGTGNWFVTVTNAEGCIGTADPYSVTIAEDPVASFVFTPLPPVPVETTVQFTDLSSAGAGGVITDWQWDFGLGSGTSNEPSPAFTYNGPGDYIVSLIITTADGCVDTTTALYVVYPPEIIIPNVFTPNGDNLNDVFSIENLRYYGHELRIYSRWGTLVYESSDAAREWRASDQPDGTYYYVLVLNDGRELAGHVTVLR